MSGRQQAATTDVPTHQIMEEAARAVKKISTDDVMRVWRGMGKVLSRQIFDYNTTSLFHVKW